MVETKPDQSGSRQPLAAMFWASVSTEVDRRISSNLSAPIRLRPDEWRSGDILWIADMIGDMSAGHALVKNVLDTTLAGRTSGYVRWTAMGGRFYWRWELLQYLWSQHPGRRHAPNPRRAPPERSAHPALRLAVRVAVARATRKAAIRSAIDRNTTPQVSCTTQNQTAASASA